MTDIPNIHSLAKDDELLNAITTAISKLPPNNLYVAFFKKLASNRGRYEQNPRDLALTIAEHGDKHPINFEIPANPGEIPSATLQQYLLTFDEKEMNALGVASGIRQPIGRRNFMRTAGLLLGGIAVGGAVGYTIAKRDTPTTQETTPKKSDSSAKNNEAVPEPSLLMLVGGLIIAVSLVQNARKKRRENPTIDYAMQHLPETLIDILVEQDKQIKAALAEKAARSGAGPTM